jgi:hypothetical protein
VRKLFISTLLAGAAFAAQPAQAAIIFHFDDSGAIQPDEVTQVLNDQTALTVLAYTNQTNREVAVHSLDGGTLATSSSGQAVFSATDGSLDMGEIFLTGVDNDFREIEFLFEGGAPKGVTLTFSVGGSNPYTQSITLPKKAEGTYWFSAEATGTDYFTKVTYDVTGATFTDLKQLRIGGFGDTPVVPEPATWALMLAGFGTVGYSMRRRRNVAVSFA